MTDRVTTTIDGHIAEVVLNRAEKLNALDVAMIEGITAAGERLAGNDDVRVVIVRGAGGNFSAGLDLDLFRAFGDKEKSFLAAGFLLADGQIANAFQRPAWIWRQLPVPVIAVLEGVVFGGGLQIALGPDFRLAAPDARLSVMEIKWGLIPDMTATQTLRDLVGLDVAKELVMTGRIVSGQEAAGLGLVTRACVEPLAAARTLAREIASRSPDAVRAAKRLLDAAWHADAATGLALEASLQKRLIGSPNQIESIMAAMDKRDPEYGAAGVNLDG